MFFFSLFSFCSGSRLRPLDISYVTSRILVMSFPHDTPSHPYQNTIDEVGVYLEETHPSQYLVFNLSGDQYDVSKLNGQVGVAYFNHGINYYLGVCMYMYILVYVVDYMWLVN